MTYLQTDGVQIDRLQQQSCVGTIPTKLKLMRSDLLFLGNTTSKRCSKFLDKSVLVIFLVY